MNVCRMELEYLEKYLRNILVECKDEPRYGEVNIEHLAGTWRVFCASGMGCALGLYEVWSGKCCGTILGMCVHDPLTGSLVATAYIWAVSSSHRKGGGAKRLLEAFEKWAVACGAKEIVIGVIESEKADKLARAHRMLGYRPATRSLKKRLGT